MIDPVALQLGPIAIRWYALAYLAGFLLGWAYALRLSHENGKGRPSKADIDDFMVWAIPAVIIGGRVGYVLFYNLEYYASYPLEALKVWQGGMSFHGGILGMAVAIVLYAWKHQFFVLKLSDIIACVAPIGLLLGRVANFINAELYGRVTDLPLGMVFPGTDGQPRHPSQLYEALLEGVVIFVILFIMTKKNIHQKIPGILTATFLVLYGTFRFFIEYVREPDQHLGLFFEYISMGQILCLPMIAAGIFIYFYAIWHQKHVSAS